MSPEEQHRSVRTLEALDVPALIRLRQASFGTPRDPVDPKVLAILEGRTPYMRGVDVDGALVAACTWYPKPAWIGGVHQPTGALAAVISAPESRRRGHVRALITDGLRALHEANVGWSGEHPFDPRFYDRMGYRCVPSSVVLQVPFGRLATDDGRGERLSADRRDAGFAPVPITDPEMRRIRRTFASARSFALDRDDPPGFEVDDAGIDTRWADLLDPPTAAAPHAKAYLCDGGYAIVAVEGHGRDGVLHVVDMAWSDPRGRRNVFAMLMAWEGQAGTVRLELPADDPLARRDVAEWSKTRTPLQMRVVCVASALTHLRAPEGMEGRATVRVLDALAPWNDGTWQVDTGPDGCDVTRTSAPADATLDVGALTSLLAGTSPGALLASGEATGSARALGVLHALTRDHPPFLGLADYF